jgi:uncharacterized ion transporter superfamily protein YfcC
MVSISIIPVIASFIFYSKKIKKNYRNSYIYNTRAEKCKGGVNHLKSEHDLSDCGQPLPITPFMFAIRPYYHRSLYRSDYLPDVPSL